MVNTSQTEQQLQGRAPPFHPARLSEELILWNAYRIDLAAELDRLDVKAPEKTKIEGLLDPAAHPKVWEDLYEAEQRIAAHRSDDSVKADWAGRIVEAQNLGVGSAAALMAQYASDDTPVNRKETYLTLLEDLHFRYAKRRLDRHIRMKAAWSLNFIGVLLCLFGLVLTAGGLVFSNSLEEFFARTHLIYVIWCGMLGAYFSRSVAMRSSIATLDYDILVADYSKWSVTQRLVIGAIAAFVMYLLIASNLLAGDLFPSVTYRAPPADPTIGDESLTIPSIAFAKLLIWSVIAGFSERLLPDQLSRLENSVRDQGSKKSPPAQ